MSTVNNRPLIGLCSPDLRAAPRPPVEALHSVLSVLELKISRVRMPPPGIHWNLDPSMARSTSFLNFGPPAIPCPERPGNAVENALQPSQPAIVLLESGNLSTLLNKWLGMIGRSCNCSCHILLHDPAFGTVISATNLRDSPSNSLAPEVMRQRNASGGDVPSPSLPSQKSTWYGFVWK